MRISKTACRKKQDDRLQSGGGRFLYPWYNYTICNHKIFRRYSGVPWPLPSAEDERFRRSGGLPPQARLAADGQAGNCRRPAAGGKRGRDTKVSLPLLTPQPFLRTRLPSVARLKTRGPQGRLVRQGTILDRSGAFRSDGASALHRMAAHCYARRATQGKLRA